MRVAREFVTYMSRDLVRRLVEGGHLAASDLQALTACIEQALTEEFSVEDRINEEARAILAQHESEMQRLGASYAETFKRVKAELARKHKAVL